jgi:hypothetical protein
VADDYITAHLNRLFDGALQPRRQRQVERHWTAYPPLAGRAPREVATIVADAYHPDHNLVAGALLAAHRDRAGQPTDTEMVFLLCAARPLVLMIDPTDRHADSRASLWSSVACRLAHLDVAEVAASPVPFLVALLGRIRPDAAKHPSEPARQTFPPEVQFEALTNRRASHDHGTAGSAIARIYLDAARHQRGWHIVARYTLDRHANRPPRSSVARHRRRIAEDIGYVA